MELIGTVVLPVAIVRRPASLDLTVQCLTYTLIINYAFNPPKDFSDAIPLLLLGGVLGLPAILILLTTRKVIYLTWMLVYLIALPVWCVCSPQRPADRAGTSSCPSTRSGTLTTSRGARRARSRAR